MMYRFDLDFTVVVTASFSPLNSINNPRYGGLTNEAINTRARARILLRERTLRKYLQRNCQFY